MSQVTKFRAWNQNTSSMLTSKHFAVRFDGSFFPLRKMDEWVPEKITLMQFTGLHDRNGKEIFEGDVCHIPDSFYMQGVNSIVIFRDGGYRFGQWMGGAHFIEAAIAGNLEVIGNIYENPELLEPPK